MTRPGPKPLIIHERDIEKAFTKKVKAAGGEIRKLKWIGRRGAPDRVVMINGHTCWVEFKSPGKKPSAQQLSEHRRMRAMGQWVIVVDMFIDLPQSMLDAWA